MGSDYTQNVDKLAVLAATDEGAFETLLTRYKPFIFAQVKRTTGQSFVDEHDDMASIGQIAFHEAVQTYKLERGSFLLFSGAVIRCRVIDQMRKNMRTPGNMLMIDEETGEEEEEFTVSPLDRNTFEKYYELTLTEERQTEIEELTKELAGWGISLRDVYKDAPKHKAGRDLLWTIVKAVLSDEEVLSTVTKKKYLPVAILADRLKLHRKKIEKSRRYIIACVIIARGNFPMIHDYLKL